MESYIRSACFGFQNTAQNQNFQKTDEKIKKNKIKFISACKTKENI